MYSVVTPYSTRIETQLRTEAYRRVVRHKDEEERIEAKQKLRTTKIKKVREVHTIVSSALAAMLGWCTNLVHQPCLALH